MNYRLKKKTENVFENIANDYNLIIIGPSAFVLRRPAMHGERNNNIHHGMCRTLKALPMPGYERALRVTSESLIIINRGMS